MQLTWLHVYWEQAVDYCNKEWKLNSQMLLRFFPLNEITSFDLVNAAPWASVLQQKEYWTRSGFKWPGLPLSCHVSMGAHSPGPKMYFIADFVRLIASECTACHVIIMQMVMMSSLHSQCWRSVDILQKHCICLFMCCMGTPVCGGQNR